MIKESLLFYSITFASCWILYKLITFFIYSRLKKKLSMADLDTFKSQLGEDYVFSFLSDEIRRYKWKKGLLVIKASFDYHDRQASSRILSFNFFTLFTKIIFK